MAGEKFNLQCAYNETFSLEDAMGYKTVLYICSTGTGRSAVDGSVLPKRPLQYGKFEGASMAATARICISVLKFDLLSCASSKKLRHELLSDQKRSL